MRNERVLQVGLRREQQDGLDRMAARFGTSRAGMVRYLVIAALANEEPEDVEFGSTASSNGTATGGSDDKTLGD
jgi:hypothetical protein